MTFLARACRFSPESFAADFAARDFNKASWAPKMFVLHNTGQPSLEQWIRGGATPEARLRNLQSYYKGLRWHSGPHWFVAPDGIWEFSDPLGDGVHCSCANHVAFGCEMVGDYETEAFDSGPGAQVRDNTVGLIATVFRRFGWRPDPLVLWERGLAFHHHCARDRHACPGRNVDRADMAARVLKAMGTAEPPAASDAPLSIQSLQTALNRLGAAPVLAVDGVLGPRTQAALRAWQVRTNQAEDGEVSPVTLATLRSAIARLPHPTA